MTRNEAKTDEEWWKFSSFVVSTVWCRNVVDFWFEEGSYFTKKLPLENKESEKSEFLLLLIKTCSILRTC